MYRGFSFLVFFFICSCAWADEKTAIETAVIETKANESVQQLVGRYCIDCHHSDEPKAGLDLESLARKPMADHTAEWEAVVRKLRSRQMPPIGQPLPTESDYEAAADSLETSLDEIAEHQPRPGRTATFRRLTRFEYENAIRDLLGLEIDASIWLPKDEASFGFDNVTAGELSPTLINRYLTAAEKISELAIGGSILKPRGDTFRVRPDITQEKHLEGLPIGTRGGISIPYHFPQDGQYEVTIRLARDRNEQVEGLRGEHDVLLLLDRANVKTFRVKPPNKSGGEWGNDHSKVDAHLHNRFEVTAGAHNLAVTFPYESSSLLETKRQPYAARFNMHRHPRTQPAIFQVSITGPYGPASPGETLPRQRIFNCYPEAVDEDQVSDEEACAKRILAQLARRAWRRPITETDLNRPLEIYELGRATGDFETGIEMALASILVNPQFLFRVERDPENLSPGDTYHVTDIELASRLSFFLWGSIPDDELLKLAEEGKLHDSEVLQQQTRRMLADERAKSLSTNFAGQWLYLRNLDSVQPDMRLFPDFDHNLREAMRRETELLFAEMVRENQSPLKLLQCDHTYLNERLAKHYDIPHIYGDHFRRVRLDPTDHRGGLLRHASILTVTSFATRTSPVIRGQWILKNLLGSPPPPPPDDVPALKDNTVEANLPVRERLAAHRANEACASCHNLMDPVGLALENFDAVGRWRNLEVGLPIDASGGLVGVGEFTGASGLELALQKRPELFIQTLTEKLMTFALGRGVNQDDAPAIRKIVREAKENDYRFHDIIFGIVTSKPFQMRTVK